MRWKKIAVITAGFAVALVVIPAILPAGPTVGFDTAGMLGRGDMLLAIGAIFLGVKAYEYTHKWHEHVVPGPYFRWDGPDAPNVQLFFSLYFAMTGLHALHMVVGAGLLFVLIFRSWQGMFNRNYYTPVEMVGLYWHFVDLVWIFLFPLLYLLGRH